MKSEKISVARVRDIDSEQAAIFSSVVANPRLGDSFSIRKPGGAIELVDVRNVYRDGTARIRVQEGELNVAEEVIFLDAFRSRYQNAQVIQVQRL